MDRYDYTQLSVDERLFAVQDEFRKEDLEFVLVKGVVWNKGQLLEGADIDFYVRLGGNFTEYEDIPQECKSIVETLFGGTLVSPRKTDFNSNIRVQRFHVDAEMVLNPDYATVTFANPESKDFFENGYFTCPEDFTPTVHLLRFVLNRFLEETGYTRTLSPTTYNILREFASDFGPELYPTLLSSFSMEEGLYLPPEAPPYKQLILNHLSQGGSREDLIYIKPLNKALKEIEGCI